MGRRRRLPWARKLRGSKIARSTRLRAHVEDRLAMGWSPEQIAGRMEFDGAEHTISVESIYRHAYTPGARDPRPDADPSAPDEGPSPQPVRVSSNKP
jgi:IS30 family transposase